MAWLRLILACWAFSYVFGEIEGNLLESAIKAIKPNEKSDCNPKGTNRTLKFLSLSSSDLIDKELTKEKAGFDVDCSLRRTNLDKLRTFLLTKGFIQDPGSLVLINNQDTHMKLICSGDHGDSTSYRWHVVGRPSAKDDDRAFYNHPTTGNVLNTLPPPGYLYFRKFTCFSTDKKCSHAFYVITRPQPKVDFPLQVSEGQEIKFDCEMSDCQTVGCELTKKAGQSPRPQAPYEFYWRVPPTILKNPKTGAAEYECKDTDDHTIKNPNYIQILPVNEAQGVFISDTKANPSPKKSKLKPDDGQTYSLVSQFTISKAMDKHKGAYECLVVDGNGVPSTPFSGSLHHRYTGLRELHVQPTYMAIIPASITVVIFLVMLIIWIVFRKHDKMEYDDGTPYSKEELVAPEDEISEPMPAPGPLPASAFSSRAPSTKPSKTEVPA